MRRDSFATVLCKAVLLSGLFFYLLPIHSCQPSYSKELAMLDSLLLLLDTSKEVLNAIDTTQLHDCRGQIKNNLVFIQARYTDTLDKDLAIFLLNYRSIQESLENYLQEKKEIGLAVAFAQAQVETLAKDVRNKALSRTRIEEYCRREEEETGKLAESVTFLNNNVKKAVTAFEAMNPRVRELVNTIQVDETKKQNR